MSGTKPWTAVALRQVRLAPLAFFVLIVAAFAVASPSFLTGQNALNILLQSAHLAVLAVGMTFVMLVGGIDLSIGATMYLSAVLIGLFLHDAPVWECLASAIGVGLAMGLLNALFVVPIGVAPFIVTLSTVFVGRGLGLYLSGTQVMFPGPQVSQLARASVAGLPSALALAAAAVAFAVIVLRMTPFGRNLYAIGSDRTGASKAGIPVERTIVACYSLCGVYAALGGFVSLFQVASASTTFGEGKEFSAVAAAVLGGTSLFGGRGNALGPVFGAILIQTVQAGLVLMNANPYIYPLATAGIIFLAVLIDTLRERASRHLLRRMIFIDEVAQR